MPPWLHYSTDHCGTEVCVRSEETLKRLSSTDDSRARNLGRRDFSSAFVDSVKLERSMENLSMEFECTKVKGREL